MNLKIKYIVIALVTMSFITCNIYADVADEATEISGNDEYSSFDDAEFESSMRASIESSISESIKESKSDASKKSDDEKETTTAAPPPTPGQSKGETVGAIDGKQAASEDFSDEKKSRAKHILPTRKKIISMYNLNRESAVFRSDFISSYREAYVDAYEQAFADLLINPSSDTKQRAIVHAEQLATAEGIQAASNDILNNYNNDWLRAYNQFILEQTLTERYKLSTQLSEYQQYFKTTFKDIYKKSYITHYEEYTSKLAINSTNYHTVTFFEDSIVYDKLSMNIDKATSSEVANATANLYFDKGSVYQDTMVGLHRIENFNATSSPYYDTASGIYQVTIKNENHKMDLYKPIALSFPFIGDDRIGIYEWVGTRWLYMPTEATDEGIYTMIDDSTYVGGKYALFIDKYFEVPNDIIYNWAYKDIVLSIRRGFVIQDDVFRPNDAMTRVELADLLYRSLLFRKNSNGFNYNISDIASFDSYQSQVKYVLGIGLMMLDENHAFNPNGVVSYDEFLEIVAKLSHSSSEIDEVVKAMYYDELHIPAFMNDSSKPMTRSEVVYALSRILD